MSCNESTEMCTVYYKESFVSGAPSGQHVQREYDARERVSCNLWEEEKAVVGKRQQGLVEDQLDNYC